MQDAFDDPAEAADPSFYGIVHVKIWFSDEGEYIEDESEFEAEDPHFKIMVKRLLRKVWSYPLSRQYFKQHKKFSLDFPVHLKYSQYRR